MGQTLRCVYQTRPRSRRSTYTALRPAALALAASLLLTLEGLLVRLLIALLADAWITRQLA